MPDEKPDRPTPMQSPMTIERSAMRFDAIAKKREAKVNSWRPYLALVFIIMGIAVMFGELGMYWLKSKPIGAAPIGLGAALSFIGFYMINHQDAKDAASFLTTQFISLLGALRGKAPAPVAPSTPPPGANT